MADDHPRAQGLRGAGSHSQVKRSLAAQSLPRAECLPRAEYLPRAGGARAVVRLQSLNKMRPSRLRQTQLLM